jgi:uncharacterized protein involved in outer membrane biogenesis
MRFWPRPRTWAVIAAVLIVILVAARLALPSVVKRYVNKTLQGLKGYSGHVDDIGISLWRGAYQIEELTVVKTDGKVPVPFVSARTVDLSVEWKALLHGSIVAEIELFDPKVNFVNAKSPQESQSKVDESWTDTVRALVPFDINRFAIHDGQIHYRDFEAKPRVDLFVQNLNAVARNLTNSNSFDQTLYATFEGGALAMGSGKIKFKGKIDPYAKLPTFQFDFGENGLEMKQLNPFLKAYADVDAEGGTISVDAEFQASHGRFEGYVKPFIQNMHVLNWKADNESIFRKLWEGVVQLVGNVLENPKHERIATKVPLSGNFDKPNTGAWAAIGGLLKNAFIVALQRGLEGGAAPSPKQ